MSTPNSTQLHGNVVSSLANRSFSVRLNNGDLITTFVPKEIARTRFRIVPGDPVNVQLFDPPASHRIVGFSDCLYYKRYWNEDSGGFCADWGGSQFFFEVHRDGYVARQIQRFDNGKLLLYDECNDDDRFGGRSTVKLDPNEYESYLIDRAEFINNWKPSVAANIERNGE